MKHKTLLGIISLCTLLAMSGCSQSSTAQTAEETTTSAASSDLPNIYLILGETEDRPTYEIELEDNEVSVRFVRILQEETRVLPIYIYDGSQHTDVMQFCDIPDGEMSSIQ